MPNVGLVLSGGFAKGAYQIGVLKAMKEVFGDGEIKYISASSVGTLNAYSFVQNKLDVAENMWRNLNFKGFRSFAKAYMNGTQIVEAIREIEGEFNSIYPNFYITCLNISKVELNYINLKNVAQSQIKDYLLASVMLPLFSRAIEISGNKYVDGAMIDNIPVRPLAKHHFDYAVVVHFDNNNYLFENEYFDSKLIKMNFLDDEIIKTSLSFDQDSVSHMIKCGYEESMTIFDVIFKKGVDDLEYIYQKNKFINDIRGNKSFRITGDVVLNNLNKVAKKIISYKI